MKLEEFEKISDSGELYCASDLSIIVKQFRLQDKVRRYNKTHCSPLGYLIRTAKLKRMFAVIGKNVYIEPPFHANWGGKHCYFGNGVYANSNLTLVDDGKITVGNNVMFGPNVTLCTATHPVAPELREKQIQYNLPVTIGDNCWLGAGVTVLPGVTIGENSIIGAGSLVNKDIPANVVAVGVPCKVLRPITDEDRKFYRKNIPVPQNLFDKSSD